MVKSYRLAFASKCVGIRYNRLDQFAARGTPWIRVHAICAPGRGRRTALVGHAQLPPDPWPQRMTGPNGGHSDRPQAQDNAHFHPVRDGSLKRLDFKRFFAAAAKALRSALQVPLLQKGCPMEEPALITMNWHCAHLRGN